MKKSHKIIIAIFTLLLISSFYVHWKLSEKPHPLDAKKIEDFIPVAMKKITSWDLEQYKEILTDETISSMNTDDWHYKLKHMKQHLGKNNYYQKPNRLKIGYKTSLFKPIKIVAIYDIKASFELQDAKVTMTLISTDNTIKIQSFNVNYR